VWDWQERIGRTMLRIAGKRTEADADNNSEKHKMEEGKLQNKRKAEGN
jgi:hypothetical protein